MPRPLLLVLVLLSVTAVWAADPNPFFEGKPASQWLRLLRTDSEDQWNRASQTLLMHGDEAVAPLTIALGDPDPRVRRGAAVGLRQLTAFPPPTLQALRRLLQDPSLPVRAEVVETLLDAHDYASPLPETLRPLLDAPAALRPEARGYLLMTLPLDRRPYLDLVLAALQHSDPLVRVDAAEALRHKREISAQTAAPLRAALADPDVRVRVAAAESYWSATEDAAPLLGVLVDALKTAPDASSRAAAAGVLGDLGDAARATFAALAAAATDDSDGEVRKAAAGAIPELGVEAEIVLPVLVRLLKDQSQAGWEGALHGLLQLGPAAQPALLDLLPQLMAALQGDYEFSSVPALAAEAVGAIGPPARVAVPLLVRLMNVPYQASGPTGPPGIPDAGQTCNTEVQRAALLALAKVSPTESLPHLIKALASKDAWMVKDAAQAIGAIGPPAKQAVLPLVHALVTEDDKVDYSGLNESLFRALIRLDDRALPENLRKIARLRPNALFELAPVANEIPNPADYMAPAIEVLEKPYPTQAKRAIGWLLARLGEAAAPAAEALGRAITRLDFRDNHDLVWALQAMGPAARPALPFLLSQLRRQGDTERFGIADILEGIGPAAAEALPLLMGFVINAKAHPVERLSAAWAVKGIGGDVSALVAPLLQILDQQDSEMRGAASELLGEVGPPAAAALPSLRRVLAEGKPYARARAAEAIWRISGDVTGVLPATMEVGKGEMGPGKVIAVLLVGKMGPAAAPATDTLKDLLAGKSPTVALAAALSLADLARDGAVVPATLARLLREYAPGEWVDEMMLQDMLAPGLQSHAAELVGPLSDLIKTLPSEDQKVEAILVARQLGPLSQPLEPLLEQLAAGPLDDRLAGVAREALQALRGRGRSLGWAKLMRCSSDEPMWRFPTPD